MNTRHLLAACGSALALGLALPTGASAAVAPATSTGASTTASATTLSSWVPGTAAGALSAALPTPVSAGLRPTARAQRPVAGAVNLRVPRLGIVKPLLRLHVQKDRSLTVPKNFADVGWWSEGPRPGGAGAVIVGGHISSKAGPGAFFNLRKMRVNDLVYVDRADRTTAVIQVRAVKSFSRSNYPNALVYRTTGRPSIHLITCDGVFDPRIGHHVNNLVVFADLVSTRPTR
jgi:sortase (surface protein transpeptidase)